MPALAWQNRGLAVRDHARRSGFWHSRHQRRCYGPERLVRVYQPALPATPARPNVAQVASNASAISRDGLRA